ncbi:cell cycle checkpoint protein RAD17 isoform X2 [Aricia agestis]|uniref:cell cycle checkpoint protein RAD17 isoform X2 n=2 Tax=Aricia agestis TaxID=91739 RepID=UPI001C203F4B|nr:cell cycle checkpoint protein RAD17 isoform X2 [Aricia agestis]
MQKKRQWFNPLFEFDDNEPTKKTNKPANKPHNPGMETNPIPCSKESKIIINISDKNWMKNFDPIKVEDLAVHNKKVQEVEEWLKSNYQGSNSSMLLLSGPVGAGKTATIHTLATKYNIKVTEWVTPLDIEYPSDYGDYEFKESQSKKFVEFIIKSANFTSLLDNNSCKLVLVEDFPNVFMRTPTEFTEVLLQYRQRALSPIIFICSETHTENKNTAISLFTPTLKEQFNIHHISFNSVSATGLKSALKRAAEVISKKYSSSYNTPTTELIDSVVNSSGGDIRSAILNLHFACLKGSSCSLETSFVEKETKTKSTKRKKNVSSKFMSLGKDQTVSILHGVGRVLNPKVTTSDNGIQVLSHSPRDVIEQFLTNPISFVNFLEENYLPHFSCMYDADKAASALSDADYLLAEWREKLCQEFGLYVAVAGLMLANKSPVSAWNPVRGPKNMKIQFPSQHELKVLDPNQLYKGKILASDFVTYCKIIGNKANETNGEEFNIIE